MMAGQSDTEDDVSKDVAPRGAEVPAGAEVATVDEWSDVEPFVNEDGEILLAGEAAHKLRQALALIPVDDEDANERIIQQLFMGDQVTDLNAPWDASGGREFAGKALRIDTIKAQESQFQNGLRAFLVVQGWCPDTGKDFTLTTSALAVMVQLARVNAEGWLPAWCTVEVAARPTKRGHFPYHLRFMPPQDGPAK